MTLPVLWSFRRCPYAMRARLALASAEVTVELREVILRDKPAEFLETSPSATVPCLQTSTTVIDESFDIMLWALSANDPERWLEMPAVGFDLIGENDGSFKTALDRYKYCSRHENVDVALEQRKAGLFLHKLNRMLVHDSWLFGTTPSLADIAILPFVRQFAHVGPEWFNDQPWPCLIGWLERFKSSDRFADIMTKYPPWQPGDAAVLFPQ